MYSSVAASLLEITQHLLKPPAIAPAYTFNAHGIDGIIQSFKATLAQLSFNFFYYVRQ